MLPCKNFLIPLFKSGHFQSIKEQKQHHNDFQAYLFCFLSENITLILNDLQMSYIVKLENEFHQVMD